MTNGIGNHSHKPADQPKSTENQKAKMPEVATGGDFEPNLSYPEPESQNVNRKPA